MSSLSASRAVRRVFALTAAVVLLAGCGRGDGATPATAATAEADPALVQTASGTVRGLLAPDLRFFGAIPYAAPPIGPLRWRPPAPAVPWTGVRDAAEPGPRCLQNPEGDLEMGRNTSEDCLTLNVWTPEVKPSDGRRPVLVWIHGGGFINGSGGIYNAKRLTARGDMVVVTLNYRLGALGFLAHPALGDGPDVGNYGLADQQAALRWVHDNIAAFGGDPDKVTIAGESAGGMSVCDHLVAPDSAGLFRAAMIQSGPCQAQVALPEAQRASTAYANALGCTDPASAADCLRRIPAERLRKPVWYYHIGEDSLSGPVFGTASLPVDPVTAFDTGSAAKVPVVIGTTRDEFTLFVALQYVRAGKRFTAASYPHLLSSTFGADAAAVAENYPLSKFNGNVPQAYSAAVTDGVFSCVGDRIGDALTHGASVYGYEFSDPAPPTPDPFSHLPFPLGASHSLDLRYIFDMGGAPPMSDAQLALSDQMIDYWSAFVATGRPEAPGGPQWPQLTGGTDDQRLSFRPDGTQVTSDFEAVHQCAFWESLKH
ncbi:carboxylesterase family protein [Mycobacterium sp. OTB74]|jgi:para-nitrobenzyl esterase|uniref:carboxylesterase/lipase family protein n=1 Tax=Mycobacterium sp. OTB74 TaxID=1853452 RepID=UPI002473ABBA|nr:carboxylesterase family protein [Mycobacterium sp. OTB74]MDH6244808.1 para-nitrobenzyl esterase [Mycobacterium sp. OTB74]